MCPAPALDVLKGFLAAVFKTCVVGLYWKNLRPELMELQPPTVQPHVWCSDFQLDARQSVSPAYFVKGYTKLFLRCCWTGLTHPICLGCVKWAHLKKTTLRTGLQFVQRMKEGGRTGWKNKPFRVPISGSGRSSFVLMGELALGCYGCPIPHLPHQSPLMGLK